MIKHFIKYVLIVQFLILQTLANGINLSASVYASDLQQQAVTGTVTDAITGEPMPGVNIVVKGTTIGALTDLSGRYSVTVSDPNDVLVFTFIGYRLVSLLIE